MTDPLGVQPQEHVDRYYRYPSERDVLFLLGAGASVADGVPLQANLLSEILVHAELLRASPDGRMLLQMFGRYFGLERPSESSINLETIFGFLDYFISQDQNLTAELTAHRLRELREYLIKAIHFAVGSRRTRSTPMYSKFWEEIGQYNRNVSVASLNYDPLLEEAFDPLFARLAYIDLCIPLMNYDMPEGLDGFNWWVNPREPIAAPISRHPIPIKVLKIHGSLNWKYCRTCRGLLLTPWDTDIDIERGRFVHRDLANCAKPYVDESDLLCPIDHSHFDTLILPPAHVKQVDHPIVGRLLLEFERELRATRQLVIIGYSFPDADTYLRAVMAKCLGPDTKVVVVNPDESQEFRQRHRGLGRDVAFMPVGFRDFLESGKLSHILASANGA